MDRLGALIARAMIALLAALAACNSPHRDLQTDQARREQGMAAYKAKRYEECARLMGPLPVPQRDREDDGYNGACCMALAGQRDRALARLQLVMNRGFIAVDHLEKDADLASLHGDPRWAPLVQQARANLDRHRAARNPELKRLYEEDQGDRRAGPNIDWAKVAPRDAARQARVREILAAGGARMAEDHYYAAMVLQHGMQVEDYRMAHEQAMKAVEKEPSFSQAKWLAAASKDRELVNLGKPQRYGTQFFKGKDGNSERYPVDPTVTNAERARWNVPPLAGSK